jgi:hypothetical protein
MTAITKSGVEVEGPGHLIGQREIGRLTMIRKTSGGYKVLSEKGKNLGGPYKSRAKAQKRLRQVEFFKHRKG